MKRDTGLQNFHGNAIDTSSGLCVLWSKEVDLSIHLYASYFIEFQVFDSTKNITWVGIGVYANCDDNVESKTK